MRIVHFSDPHAGGWVQSFGALFDKRIIGAINFIVNRRRHHLWARARKAVRAITTLEPDVVVCTGDLATVSEPVEFDRALNTFEPLAKAVDDFLYVPGNHDRYVERADCEAAMHAAFLRLSNAKRAVTDLPLALDVGPCRFLMVNQAVPSPPFCAWGQLDADTVGWVCEQLRAVSADRPPVMVLVAHYPLFDAEGRVLAPRRACRGIESLQDALRDGQLNLALCGHIHSPFIRRETSGALEVCAGSVTSNGRLNVIDVDENGRISQQWVSVD